MKALILGSSGIIGQTMRLCVPPGVTPVWHRKTADPLHAGCDLTDPAALSRLLVRVGPDVIINLAGQNDTDAVERDLGKAYAVNVDPVYGLAEYCLSTGCRLVQVSTQAVFRGDRPPYGPRSELDPINEYGYQKAAAELIAQTAGHWTIVRPTFVLGIRPMPYVGRTNPIEQMLAGQPRQVADRWFSTLFARDAAQELWDLVLNPQPETILHLGNPVSVSRHVLAGLLGLATEPVSHGDFPGLAPRPVDTCYSDATRYRSSVPEGLKQCRRDWESRLSLDHAERAREIALFLGINEDTAADRMNLGFEVLHQFVAQDFRRFAPESDDQLLDWYRRTEAYIWELSAYHAHPGFNYSGMCRGIVERLKAAGAKQVLCLGDGIGDLTLALKLAGLEPTYHDLAGSRTAAFAEFRLWLRCPSPIWVHETQSWDPTELEGPEYDAVVALDFFEHCTSVPDWLRTTQRVLKPGGYLMTVNAFACGSGPDGSIPCHLARNDRYEKEWDPLLSSLGFNQENSNWYRRNAA